MFGKLCLLLSVASQARAGVIGVSAPLAYHSSLNYAPVSAHAPVALPYHAAYVEAAHPAVAVAHPTPVRYVINSPVSYQAPTPVRYIAPAQVTYAATHPVAVSPARVSVATPVAYAAHHPVAVAPAKVAFASPVTYAAAHPVAVAPAKVALAQGPIAVADSEPVDPNPSYQFSYNVNDATTGDSKSQEEYLQDGVLSGRYSLAEPDGSIRTVTYTADKINGFNAHVEKTPAVPGAAVHVPAVEPEAELLA